MFCCLSCHVFLTISLWYSGVHILQKPFGLRYVEQIILHYGAVKKLEVSCRLCILPML